MAKTEWCDRGALVAASASNSSADSAAANSPSPTTCCELCVFVFVGWNVFPPSHLQHPRTNPHQRTALPLRPVRQVIPQTGPSPRPQVSWRDRKVTNFEIDLNWQFPPKNIHTSFLGFANTLSAFPIVKNFLSKKTCIFVSDSHKKFFKFSKTK